MGTEHQLKNEPHLRCNLRYCTPCNARKKRTREPCHQPAMKNGKCRFHGGKSTGPRTPEGLTRSQMANYKHGLYTQKQREEDKALNAFFKANRDMWKAIHELENYGYFKGNPTMNKTSD